MSHRRADGRAAVRPAVAPAHLALIGEAAAEANVARTHGYAPRGPRLVDAAPYGRWHATTLVGARRAGGFIAPMAIDGGVNGDLSRAHAERALGPELRPGGVVVMDDLGSHETAGVREAIERAGGRALYLPPDGPDLSPIENALSKLERLLRTAAERTVEGLWQAIGRLLDRFAPAECGNFFRHCGYHATDT